MAYISYEKIEEQTAISRNNIKQGISILAAVGLVHIEHVPSGLNGHGVTSAYRLARLETNRHLGATGRNMDIADTEFEEAL